MKRAAFPLAILAALLVGFASHELISTAQAQASPPATAVCTALASHPLTADKAARWMNEQIAAGRTRVLATESIFCAW